MPHDLMHRLEDLNQPQPQPHTPTPPSEITTLLLDAEHEKIEQRQSPAYYEH